MARLRKTTPQSPSKVKSGPTSPRQIRRSTRVQSYEPNQPASSALQDPPKSLNPVLEEDNTISVHVSQPVDQVDERDDENQLDEAEASDDDFDDYSASEDEDLAGLDKDLIIDNLSAINLDTDDIFRLLESSTSSKVVKDIQNPLSAIAKRFNHLVRRLLSNLEPCGHDSLLQPARLSYLLTKGAYPEAESITLTHSEQVFMKVNLALFAVKLLQGRWDDQDTRLDNIMSYLTDIQTFPTPFFERDQDGQIVTDAFSRAFKQSTLTLGISLLTQCYIRYARKKSVESGFDAEVLVAAVFLQDDQQQVRDVSLGASTAKSRTALTKDIESRVQEIRHFFTTDGAVLVDMEGLIQAFPSEMFVQDAISWSVARKQQLDQAIENVGGIEAIRNGLLDSQVAAVARSKKQKRQSKKSREVRALEDGAAFLRNVDEFLDATAARESPGHEEEAADVVPELPQQSVVTPQRPREVAETPQPASQPRQPLHEQHFEGVPIDESDNANIMNEDAPAANDVPPSAQLPPGSTQDVLARSERQQAVANKENIPQQRARLYERQLGAVRESFESPSRTSQTPSKRAHQATEDPDEEDDFEQDNRGNKRQRIYPAKPPVPQPRQDENPAMFIPEDEDPDAQDPSRQPPSTTPQHHAVPSSTQPTRMPPPPPTQTPPSSTAPPPASYESYQRTKQAAKANMQMTTALLDPSTNPSTNLQASYPSHQALQHNSRIQVRRAWTPGEIERLIQLIQDYQTQWSKILKVDAQMAIPMLQNRTQVQLKDKARNMKLDYLKAEMELPSGFEGVTISKAHKETFRRLGIAVEEDLVPGTQE